MLIFFINLAQIPEIKDFYELLALPTIYRLENDPVLISDNKPGLFDRKAA